MCFHRFKTIHVQNHNVTSLDDIIIIIIIIVIIMASFDSSSPIASLVRLLCRVELHSEARLAQSKHCGRIFLIYPK